MGTDAFAERAERELLATTRVRKRSVETREDLTAPEARSPGSPATASPTQTCRATLLSPRTVEYHLNKIFTKLGASSRNELDGTLPDEQTPDWPSEG